MLNVKTKMIPVSVAATGTISLSFRKISEHHTGKARNEELQKTAILDAEHTLRKILECNYKILSWEIKLRLP
jgi:hypothetical protein